jgi:predicted nucleotidyltransferase
MCLLCHNGIIEDRRIEEKLRRVLHRVIEAMAPQEVWLFGSFARGDWHELSDVDLLIVAEVEGRFIDRDLMLSDINDTGLPVQAVIYTPEEYRELVAAEQSFVMGALEDGVKLYEKPQPA